MRNLDEYEFPETYKGFSVSDLLKTWEEIRGEGTKAPVEMIRAMRDFLREYKLGLFGTIGALNLQ